MAIGTAAAIIGGSLIGAGASAYAGSKAASATKKATQTAANTELQMYQQNRADLAPYRQAGYGALDVLSQLYGLPTGSQATTAPGTAAVTGTGAYPKAFSWSGGRAGDLTAYGGPMGVPGDNVMTAGGASTGAAPPTRDLTSFYKSPDYDFRMREGLAGIGNSYAARGGALSGPAARASGRYAADLASGSFNDYANRLAAIAGIGQTATSQTANLGAQSAGNLANIYTQAGQQRASTYGQMASGINSAVQGGLQNWMFNRYLTGGGGGYPAGAYAPQPGAGGIGPYLIP